MDTGYGGAIEVLFGGLERLLQKPDSPSWKFNFIKKKVLAEFLFIFHLK
jgi:hypothetical protein